MPIGGNELVRVRLEGIQPILRVENRQATLRFYLDIWASKTPTGVAKSSPASRGQGKGGARVWIGVDDICRLHEELKARGVAIRLPPTNYPGALEMQIEDPDGNVLRLGSEPRDDPARECA